MSQQLAVLDPFDDIETEQMMRDRAFNDYLDQGQGRSVMALYRRYRDMVAKDPNVLVPTINLHQLQAWERDFAWKKQAFEYDAEENSEFRRNKKRILKRVYSQEINLGVMLLKKARLGVKKLKAKDMTATEILKFVVEGNKLRTTAVEKLQTVKDPADKEQGTLDFWDSTRHVILINQNNTTINNHG